MNNAPAPRCTCCHHPLYTDELTAYGCRPCITRVDQSLRALAGVDGLYAKLSGRLMPGSGGGGPSVSGSRTAPLPIRLEPLSLMARGGAKCPACSEQYGHAEVLRLPMAVRAAA